ncbi:hypothetical protein FOQG_09643 [Fusarium oxysporum f. sp. raphani 54005]|jgi:hypothetical protein|uniref:Uncharacterized protein n=4 Tax=Fusarium oxysporum TaxID=5507 RepID=X0BXI9_FUSOX|nr:hypothetical protein FOVG_00910 [Fusarium oxysporum f. sp. pisi HDV247]EXK86905.1 hypothetical protein FOQG_09643 [Fusarium oxysporum f. sp. raphani 54005]EXL77301.1 hypothetical protein FOPG_08285 [Fusarium oxysporum f. sp. conglutinans race 2 54008]EXM27617.1 hypothetical protein FOTG_06034 [Fusarium oxysporum f. sp. vasinfectum 25433]KAI8418548.1 hypothetical protein FOFC_01116 [Fusarium oxysporum]
MSRKGKIEAVRSGATKSKGHGKELGGGVTDCNLGVID